MVKQKPGRPDRSGAQERINWFMRLLFIAGVAVNTPVV
jgi:hypothetical protein